MANDAVAAQAVLAENGACALAEAGGYGWTPGPPIRGGWNGTEPIASHLQNPAKRGRT